METTTEPPPSKGELIRQVVAWHNRHPLARRIDESDVHGIGIVALPFAQQAANQRAKPLFSNPFIAAVKPAAIARLAWQHGSTERPGDGDWPRRDIAADRRHGDATAEIRFLRTAAIEIDGQRIRVLIGRGARPQMLGQRYWHRRRAIGLLAGVAMLGVAGSLAGYWWVAEPAAIVLEAATTAPTDHRSPSPQAPEAVAVVGAPAIDPPQPAEPEASDAQADQSAAHDDATASEPALPVGTAPSAVEAIEPADGAAIATADSIAPVGEGDRLPAAVDPAAKAAPAAAAVADNNTGPIFALATASTGSRMASELRIGLLNLPTDAAPDRAHAELMRVGQRWRVVIWPFASRQAAEAVRETLARRGTKTELIGF